jgi:hypothetical protein
MAGHSEDDQRGVDVLDAGEHVLAPGVAFGEVPAELGAVDADVQWGAGRLGEVEQLPTLLVGSYVHCGEPHGRVRVAEQHDARSRPDVPEHARAYRRVQVAVHAAVVEGGRVAGASGGKGGIQVGWHLLHPDGPGDLGLDL